MKITITNTISPKAQKIRESLRQAVGNELKRKHSLGQSAVIWRNGEPVVVTASEALITTNPEFTCKDELANQYLTKRYCSNTSYSE